MNDNNQLQQVIAQLEKFGFKFFGYSETSEPLVVAPNGQVIPLKVAYDFIKQQVEKATSGNIEKFPEGIPTLDSSPKIESKMEGAVESEKSIEKKQEKSEPQKNQNAPQTQTPTASDDDTVMPMPFGDGFAIKSFNPTKLKEAEIYIEKNSQGSNTSSRKWLAIQFEKFVKEYIKNSQK